jgi:hypothetical protein
MSHEQVPHAAGWFPPPLECSFSNAYKKWIHLALVSIRSGVPHLCETGESKEVACWIQHPGLYWNS